MLGAWIYDLSDNRWSHQVTSDRPNNGLYAAMDTGWDTNRTVIFGGSTFLGDYNSDTWVYDRSAFAKSGEYVSPYIDTGGNSSFNFICCTAILPVNTSVTFQLRTAEWYYDLPGQPFVGWDGCVTAYYTNGSAIWPGHDGARWMQYEAHLKTADPYNTPALISVEIEYDQQPEAPGLLQPPDRSWLNTSAPEFKWSFNDSDSLAQSGFEWELMSADNSSIANQSSGLVNASMGTYIPTTPISEGKWYWRVRTRDDEGIWGQFSQYRWLGIDITPPRKPNLTAQQDGWVNGSCAVSFSASDDLSGVRTYDIRLDGEPLGDLNSPLNLTNLSDGVHNLLLRAYDKAGNHAESQIRIKSDSTRPEPFTLEVDPDTWAQGDVEILFNATDRTSGIKDYEVSVDGAPFEKNESPLSLTNLTDGIHFIKVRAFDKAGNFRDENAVARIDKTPPGDFFMTLSPHTWTSSDPVLTFSALDNLSAVNDYSVAIDNGSFVKATSPYTVTNLNDGVHDITVLVTDQAGNANEQTVLAFIDKTPPEAFVPVAYPENWTALDPTVSFATSDSTSGIDHYEMSIDGGRLVTKISPVALRDLPEGRHTIIVRAYDLAGNYRDGNVTVGIDHSAPINVGIMINKGAKSTNDQIVNLTISAEDSTSGLSQICYSNDGINFTLWEPNKKDREWTLSPGFGTKIVYMKVKDNAGNQAVPVKSTIEYEPAQPGTGSTLTIPSLLILILAAIGLVIWRAGFFRR